MESAGTLMYDRPAAMFVVVEEICVAGVEAVIQHRGPGWR